MFLKCDLNTYDFKDLNMQFDVILVEPPLEEYQQTIGYSAKLWNWNQVVFLYHWLIVKYQLKMKNSIIQFNMLIAKLFYHIYLISIINNVILLKTTLM